MLSHDYKEISPKLLEQAYGNAWSIENMEDHEAADRSVEYKGSRIEGDLIYDYYQDNTGAWWFQNRAILDNRIVSMDVYIFGREIKKERFRRWDRRVGI